MTVGFVLRNNQLASTSSPHSKTIQQANENNKVQPWSPPECDGEIPVGRLPNTASSWTATSTNQQPNHILSSFI